MSSTIASRISQIIDYKETNIAQFERTIGASSGVIRKAIAQNSDIQSKWLTAISDNYPDISPLWLLTGRGGCCVSPPRYRTRVLPILSSGIEVVSKLQCTGVA